LPLDMIQVVKTLGSALLLSLMDDDVTEIPCWHYDTVSRIFTGSYVNWLSYMRIVITLYLVPSITVHCLYVCIVFLLYT